MQVHLFDIHNKSTHPKAKRNYLVETDSGIFFICKWNGKVFKEQYIDTNYKLKYRDFDNQYFIAWADLIEEYNKQYFKLIRDEEYNKRLEEWNKSQLSLFNENDFK